MRFPAGDEIQLLPFSRIKFWVRQARGGESGIMGSGKSRKKQELPLLERRPSSPLSNRFALTTKTRITLEQRNLDHHCRHHQNHLLHIWIYVSIQLAAKGGCHELQYSLMSQRMTNTVRYLSQLYMPSIITKTKHTQSQVFWCHLCQFHDEYMNINVTFVTANLAEGEILCITLKWACGHFAVRGGSQRMSINVPHHHDPHQTSYSYQKACFHKTSFQFLTEISKV